MKEGTARQRYASGAEPDQTCSKPSMVAGSHLALVVLLLLVVGVIARDLSVRDLFSKGAIPGHGYWSLGSATHVGSFLLGTLLGAFTIVGFGSAANLAEETRHPARVVPRAMGRAVLASGVLGFLFLLAVTAAAEDLVAPAQSSTPIADVIKSVLGSFIGDLLLILIVISIFACVLVNHDHRGAADLGDVA